ncbi:MAG TPA: hypothetical protein VNG33_10825, partial [Polyangiaceae bacterium]|nr:hypothetical protein [Polyangiaceae bacterium]
NAGNPSTSYPTVYVRGGQAWSAPIDYWYVIQVKGDIDGDGVPMQGVTTNFNTELFIDHEAE